VTHFKLKTEKAQEDNIVQVSMSINKSDDALYTSNNKIIDWRPVP